MKKLTVMFSLSILLVASMSFFPQTTKEEMMKKVEEWNKQFSAAMIVNDKATMLSFYADDAYSLPSYTPMLVGKKAIENSMSMDENSLSLPTLS